jgi:hypothetical protein
MPTDLFHDEVQAEVTGITYRPRTGIGYLHLRQQHVPDMTGTIHLFQRIDSEVWQIKVYDGRHLNTVYTRHTKNQWNAACELAGKWTVFGLSEIPQ